MVDQEPDADAAGHLHTIKVRGFHCDVYGHVNNARYLEFLEEARWEFVATEPVMTGLLDDGLGFVVTAIAIEYRRPVGPGQEIGIRSCLVECDQKRCHMQQEIRNLSTGKLVAAARVSFAVVDLASGRAVVLPDELRRALAPKSGAESDS